MVDVIGRCGAASGVVTVYKYHAWVFLFSLSSCSHTVCNSLFTLNIYNLLIQCVYFTSSIVCFGLSIYIPPCKYLSFSLRHMGIDMGLFAWISHFLFGVCIRSLVLVPSTHQTLMLLKWEKETERRIHRKHLYMTEWWRMGQGCV